jgi:hypothetical protein
MLARSSTFRTMIFVALAIFLAPAIGGCSFGPRVLEQTHGRYNESVCTVYEEQLLRNLVHMRYNEAPAALNVSGIAAQYELTGQAEARPFFIAPNPSNSNIIFRTFTSILPDAILSGANRPTISLDPVDGSEATRQFLTPIPLETLIFLARTNWPIDTVLRLWVERLNGVPNAGAASGPPGLIISDFVRFQHIVELIQAARDRDLCHVRTDDQFAQVGGLLPASAITASALVDAAKNGLEYRLHSDGKQWALVRPERRLILDIVPGAEQTPEMLELEKLLNLVPGLARYDLVVKGGPQPDPMLHPLPQSPTVNIVPRSTSQVYFYLANGVEVPVEHLKCGVAAPTVDVAGRAFDAREITRGLFEVHSAKGLRPPSCAYVAVKYRGYWYYIDDRDQQSKATFALMLQLSRLDFGRTLGSRSGPVLTLPTGR